MTHLHDHCSRRVWDLAGVNIEGEFVSLWESCFLWEQSGQFLGAFWAPLRSCALLERLCNFRTLGMVLAVSHISCVSLWWALCQLTRTFMLPTYLRACCAPHAALAPTPNTALVISGSGMHFASPLPPMLTDFQHASRLLLLFQFQALSSASAQKRCKQHLVVCIRHTASSVH